MKCVAFMNMAFILVTRDTFHLEISALNTVAPRNMLLISVTRDTFHLEISWLKSAWPLNNPDRLVILDTSHVAIGPRSPAQSPTAEASKHDSTAAESSDVECGLYGFGIASTITATTMSPTNRVLANAPTTMLRMDLLFWLPPTGESGVLAIEAVSVNGM